MYRKISLGIKYFFIRMFTKTHEFTFDRSFKPELGSVVKTTSKEYLRYVGNSRWTFVRKGILVDEYLSVEAIRSIALSLLKKWTDALFENPATAPDYVIADARKKRNVSLYKLRVDLSGEVEKLITDKLRTQKRLVETGLNRVS